MKSCRYSLKRFIIFILLLLLLSTGVTILLFIRMYETLKVYRNNTYNARISTLVSEIENKMNNYEMAMEITALNPTIRDNIFRRDVQSEAMPALSTEMNRILNSSTYLLAEPKYVKSHVFYTYLPSDGKSFYPLAAMTAQGWYPEYVNQGESDYHCFTYDSIRSEYQFLVLHPINDFNTNKSSISKGSICYQVMQISAKAFFSPDRSHEEIRAYAYLFDSRRNAMVYAENAQLAEDAKRVVAAAREGEAGAFERYSWKGELESGTLPTIRHIASMDADLVVLFEQKPFYLYVTDSGMTYTSIFLMATYLFTLLFLFFFYYGFSKRINGVVLQLDHFDENEKIAGLPEEKHQDEIGRIEYHTILMQNRIKTLIEEEYKIKLQNISAQYEVLSAYINPHFLYNTLNSISAMAAIEGAEDTQKMVFALSDMFKYSADMNKNQVTLKDELKHIEDYLYIQEIRYNQAFVFKLDVAEKLLTCKMPKLLLQPLVENCFKHGFAKRSGSKGGKPDEVIVSAIQDGKYLKIYVMDNGRGITSERLEEVNALLNNSMVVKDKTNSEIGLVNVHKRLRLLYGPQCGIEISCHEHIYTCVKLVLRYEKEVEDV